MRKLKLKIDRKSPDCLARIYKGHKVLSLRNIMKQLNPTRNTIYWNKKRLIHELLKYPFAQIFAQWDHTKIKEVLRTLGLSFVGTRSECLDRLCASIPHQTGTLLSPDLQYSKEDTSFTLSNHHKIHLHFCPSDDVFPDYWHEPDINVTYLAPHKRKIHALQEATINSLQKYPQTILQHLNMIVFFRELKFYCLRYGGTYSIYKGSIYVEHGYTNGFVEKAIHHEFSSIIIEKYGEDRLKRRWTKVLPPNFSYGTGGVDALRNNWDSTLDEKMWKKGLLSQYSGASFEEDFNVLAEQLWLGTDRLWQAAQQSKVIYDKLRIVISVYALFDQRCTESYFQGLRKYA